MEEYLNRVKRFLYANIVSVISLLVAIVSITGSIIYVTMKNCPTCDECRCPSTGLEVEKDNEEIKPVTFKVDVKGAVNSPGVYELSENSTVADALESAGGVTSKGDTSNINMAKKLSDEMVIYVFTSSEINSLKSKNEIVCEIPKCECETVKTESICVAPTTSVSETKDIEDKTSSNVSSNAKINLNTATVDDLSSLEGIGESKAKAIIDYREKNGGFKSIEEIKNVSGIGDKAFEKIKDVISI